MATPLIVPGLHGSCSGHWQTWLEDRLPLAHRFLQANWDTADIGQWAHALEKAIRLPSDRVLLIAHSFGCLASVAAANRMSSRIVGALLVAPCDTSHFDIDEQRIAAELPFPSVLVASRNDPWMSYKRATIWAARWGSQLVDVGYQGHINVASGYGPWPDVLPLIAELSGNGDALLLKRRDVQRLDCAV